MSDREVEAVARDLREYGDELRADWSDFDGRAAKRFLYELADRLDAARHPQAEDHEPDADGWIDPRTCPHPEVRGGFCRRCGLVLSPLTDVTDEKTR